MSVTQLASVAARTIAGLLPDDVLARILPRSLSWKPAEVGIARAPEGEVRLLIASANSAGQAFRWARAVEGHLPGVAAVNLMTVNESTARYGFPADVTVPENAFVFASGWRKQQKAAVQEFTHVLVESGRYVYGSVPGRSPLEAVQELIASGQKVALLWHGSDIRIPSEHAAQELDSPFGEAGTYPAHLTAVLERNARERRSLVDQTDIPVFVSTPGLLHVPRARWLPVVVDVESWASKTNVLQEQRPLVTYVPSNSPLKGDDSIDQQLNALSEEGLIRYRRLEGLQASEMPEAYRSADIVLDQFRLGDYGVAACEAMAAGRVVVGHVSPEVRERVRSVSGIELPIVESRYTDIGQTIRRILSDRPQARVRALAGPAFVRKMHDGAASARVLSEFLAGESAPDLRSTGKHDV